jgi:lysophospholipase L1-like esterase
VPQRKFPRFAAIGAAALAVGLALSAWIVVRAVDSDAARAVSSVLIEPHRVTTKAGRTRAASVPEPLAACEARIERQPHRLPTVAIAGASYTAGTGPNNPELSWAVDLARQLRWNAVIYGVPGAGYVTAGTSGRGPMRRMLSTEELHELGPALVIVQAGFDDIGVPAGLEERRVGAAVDLIRAAAPHAKLGLLTTFGFTPEGSPPLLATDHAIIAGGTAADPAVIVMDPLAGRWAYPRARAGSLHPSAAGDAWIARTVATILRGQGVRAAPATSTAPVICDVSVGAGKPTSATA